MAKLSGAGDAAPDPIAELFRIVGESHADEHARPATLEGADTVLITRIATCEDPVPLPAVRREKRLSRAPMFATVQ